MKRTRNILAWVPAFALACFVSMAGTATAEDAPRVSRHTFRPANAGSVAQLATASQNVAPSRVVKAQPLIGKTATVNNVATQSTRELSASGVVGVETQASVYNVAQPLVVNPVAQTTHAQIVTNQYATVQQPTVYTTYTNYGHPSSYTVQTGYAPTYVAPSYTATTYVPTYTRTYRSFPVYTSTTYCSTPYYSYPTHTHYRSSYYRRPAVRVGYSYGHYSHGNHYGHRGHYGHRSYGYRSSGHFGYHGSKVSIGFSFGRGIGYCR